MRPRHTNSKGSSTQIAPQTAYAASLALCVTDWAAQPNPQLNPAHTDFWPAAIQSYVDLVCRFNGSRPAIHTFDYYILTDSGGMEGWVGQVNWLMADSLPTKWSPVNHESGTWYSWVDSVVILHTPPCWRCTIAASVLRHEHTYARKLLRELYTANNFGTRNARFPVFYSVFVRTNYTYETEACYNSDADDITAPRVWRKSAG